jgi:hypothetical protein
MSDPADVPGEDIPVVSSGITDYDRAHFKEYIMMLDGDAAGASWQVIMRIVFKVDPDADPPRFKSRFDAHLARARWMTDEGYKHLLDSQR